MSPTRGDVAFELGVEILQKTPQTRIVVRENDHGERPISFQSNDAKGFSFWTASCTRAAVGHVELVADVGRGGFSGFRRLRVRVGRRSRGDETVEG